MVVAIVLYPSVPSLACYLSLPAFCTSAHWRSISQLLFLTFLKFIPFCHLRYKNHFVPLLTYSLRSVRFLAYTLCSQQNSGQFFFSAFWISAVVRFYLDVLLPGWLSQSGFPLKAFLCVSLFGSCLFRITQLRSPCVLWRSLQWHSTSVHIRIKGGTLKKRQCLGPSERFLFNWSGVKPGIWWF